LRRRPDLLQKAEHRRSQRDAGDQLADYSRLSDAQHAFAEKPTKENKQRDLQQEQRFRRRPIAFGSECRCGQKSVDADERYRSECNDPQELAVRR
jgi:hypothetical protein